MLKKLLPLAMTLAMTTQAQAADFTQEQTDKIGEIAAQYLIDHPEVLVQVSQKLQEQQAKEQQSLQVSAVLEQQDALLNDPKTPFVGPKDAKINIIEFFDYQCIYCFKISSKIEALQEQNPNIRFIFKETPIFGGRWEPSKYAAQVGLAIFEKSGSKAYQTYHNSVYATGKNEGKLTALDVDNAAKKADVDPSALKTTEYYQKNMQLFAQLGFRGTPGIIVMPSTGATAENTFVINGADEAALESAISALQK